MVSQPRLSDLQTNSANQYVLHDAKGFVLVLNQHPKNISCVQSWVVDFHQLLNFDS